MFHKNLRRALFKYVSEGFETWLDCILKLRGRVADRVPARRLAQGLKFTERRAIRVLSSVSCLSVAGEDAIRYPYQ